jgi:hypothetical protein
VDTFNIRVIELTTEDLQRASINGGLVVPMSPDTRSVNIKGIMQAKEPLKVAAGE